MNLLNIAAVAFALGAIQPSRTGPTVYDPVSIYFDSGSSRLTLDYREFVRRFAEIMSRPDQQGSKFLLMGHTDTAGSPRQNMLLSCRRVRAVRSYLVELGVVPDRIIAEGYGEERPIAGAADEDNRRVAFLLIRDPSLAEWRQRYGVGRPC